MKDEVEGALAEVGWNGLLFLEIQAVTNLGEVKFLAHLHGFVWRSGRKGMGLRSAGALLNKKFQGIGHAKGVTLGLMKKSFPSPLPTRFFYATKLPDIGKSFSPVQGSDCAFGLENRGRMKKAHFKNYTNLDALRIARILGQYQIDDTVLAVGEGCAIKAFATDALTAKVEDIGSLNPDPNPERVLKVFSKILRD
jgi:hypothetical protein